MLMDINMPKPRLQLNRLFCGYTNRLEVIAVYLRRLLSVELDTGEEASPLNDFPCCCRQRQQLSLCTRCCDGFLLTSALVDSATVQLKKEAVGAPLRDSVVGVCSVAYALEDLSVVFS
jgi:hypothetical protein